MADIIIYMKKVENLNQLKEAENIDIFILQVIKGIKQNGVKN